MEYNACMHILLNAILHVTHLLKNLMFPAHALLLLITGSKIQEIT